MPPPPTGRIGLNSQSNDSVSLRVYCRLCVSSKTTNSNAYENLHCTLISVVAFTVTPPVVAKQTYEPSSLREIEGM